MGNLDKEKKVCLVLMERVKVDLNGFYVWGGGGGGILF